jgi:pimeloyl-ACP methyl ester carboxylesterase
VSIPVLVIHGGASHPAAQRANALLCEALSGTLAVIDGAAHFMIATHAHEVARLVSEHVHRAERVSG